MRIAIEAQRIFRKEKHGMDFVALELIRALQSLDKENEYFILVAPGPDRCLVESPNFRVLEFGTANYLLWEQVYLPLKLRAIRPDIVHCTSNTAPILNLYTLVLTLHDIIFLERKIGSNVSMYQNLGRHYRRYVVPRVLKEARKVITVSDFEREQILHGVNLSADSVVTVYNGVGEQFCPVESPSNTSLKYTQSRNYWFLLGNTDPKKNLDRSLCAYAHYVRKSASPKDLVIADLSVDYLEELLKKYDITEVRSRIQVPGYISNKDLPAMYGSSFAFLYPSLRESFGLPVLEAMACAKPVITSSTSALPEVAGPGAMLVNPESVEDIAEMMLSLETNEELYRSQVSYGLERAKKFSWKKTAMNTLMLYNKICDHE